MIDKLKDYLNENSSIQWVRFGEGVLPSPPYGVLKTEQGIDGRNIRAIIHIAQYNGCINVLEDLLRSTVTMVQETGFTSRNGCYNHIGLMIDYTDVAAISDDDTISMEALFLMPTKTF
jgi:hypothetical protein